MDPSGIISSSPLEYAASYLSFLGSNYLATNLFIQSLWAGTFHFVVLTITEWLSNCFIYDFPKSWALGTRICWSLVWMWSCCVVWGWIVAIGPQDEEDIKVPLWMEDFLPHGIAKLIKNKK